MRNKALIIFGGIMLSALGISSKSPTVRTEYHIFQSLDSLKSVVESITFDNYEKPKDIK